ncbi:MAG: phospholipid carrier-dependent glycosyltransferase [Deltaproteobacteria bacterium]|nr:MAG: phospholipid carrier-dependent glycosyltransferase [Deltaproteobacteria bacterium]
MEVRAQAVADRAAGVSVAAGRAPAPGRWALALAVAASALVALRVDLPPYFDNEGRYAEVAREMVVLGDYATPHLDFALFLNKPPLLYWLTALVFHVIGPSEWARLVSVAAGAVTLLATCRLGALLYGEPAGLVAGLALATSAGFVLEARTLRPDMLLTAAVVVALWCWRRAIAADRRRGRWLAAMYVALGAGVLTKGLVPLVVFGIPVALVTLRDEGWRGFGRLRPGLGVAVLAAIVLPWHVLAAFRHPGFAWDYIVNQHLLFFLDRKLPRDSSGDPLGFFWAAYAARAIPWVLLVPLTLAEAVRGARRKAPGAPRATALVWAWAGGLLFFFSCAPSRLEHYSMPALPAAALLAARLWQRARTAELGPQAWRLLAATAALVVVAGAASRRRRSCRAWCRRRACSSWPPGSASRWWRPAAMRARSSPCSRRAALARPPSSSVPRWRSGRSSPGNRWPRRSPRRRRRRTSSSRRRRSIRSSAGSRTTLAAASRSSSRPASSLRPISRATPARCSCRARSSHAAGARAGRSRW